MCKKIIFNYRLVNFYYYMNAQYLKQLIDAKESNTVEFKVSFSKAVIESLVAFSNTIGGSVIVGCKDNDEITGVSISEESIQKWINEIKQNTLPALIPTIEIIEITNKKVVVLKVQEFPIKPVSYKDRFFTRNLSRKLQLLMI